MKGITINDQTMVHNIYDASGERTLKAAATILQFSVNGQPITYQAKVGNYTTYASGYLVVGANGHTQSIITSAQNE
jgi:hypothetical protein